MNRLRAVRNDGVGALAERVLADLDAVVARMGESYRQEIPEYAALSDAELAREVLPVSKQLVTTFLACVVEARQLTPRELEFFAESGRQRLVMGMPLESVLHAYRIAGREAWAVMVEAVPAGETGLLADLGTRWMDIVDRSSSVLAQAYVAASYERLKHVDARRRELVEALLSAEDAAEVAAVSLRFSTVLATSYVPVLVHGAPVGIDALLQDFPAGTLGGHRGDRVLLLVPRGLDMPPLRPGSLVCFGSAAACGPALLQEVQHVERLLLTALAEGHTEGRLGPDDLLVEQLLLGNARVADALRRRVVELLGRKDPSGAVAATLRVYLETGSVPETARREVVHANTVIYRLGRVRDITGLDPRVPRDAALLVLGMGLPAEEAP